MQNLLYLCSRFGVVIQKKYTKMKKCFLFLLCSVMLFAGESCSKKIRPATPDLALFEINGGEVRMISEAVSKDVGYEDLLGCMLHYDVTFTRDGKLEKFVSHHSSVVDSILLWAIELGEEVEDGARKDQGDTLNERYPIFNDVEQDNELYCDPIRDEFGRIVLGELDYHAKKDTVVYVQDEKRATVRDDNSFILTRLYYKDDGNSADKEFIYLRYNNGSREVWIREYEILEMDSCNNWVKRRNIGYYDIYLLEEAFCLCDINLPLDERNQREAALLEEVKTFVKDGTAEVIERIDTRKIEYYE